MAAAGMTNKAIAAGLGHRREQGGALADALREGGIAGDREGAAARRQPRREGHPGAGGVAHPGHRGDDADGAGGRHALVVPVDGAAPGHDAQLRQPGVAVARPQAAPDPDIQAEPRPALRGEACRTWWGCTSIRRRMRAVFSFDEKSQIQALDRTQPGLPMKTGRGRTMTHDYKRHGTTTLFAALEVASGKVIGRTYRKHRHQEVLRFLREVDKAVPADQEIHLVLDNYATHKHEKVLDWIERKQRIFLHFTPTSASWANPGRAVLRDVDGKATPARRLHLGAPSREVPEGVPEELQRRSATVGVDEIVRRDHGESRTRPDRSGQYFLITILLRTLH